MPLTIFALCKIGNSKLGFVHLIIRYRSLVVFVVLLSVVCGEELILRNVSRFLLIYNYCC